MEKLTLRGWSVRETAELDLSLCQDPKPGSDQLHRDESAPPPAGGQQAKGRGWTPSKARL